MYLIKTRGLSYEEAFELVRAKRPLIKVRRQCSTRECCVLTVVQPNLGFIEQLKLFARKTNGKN